MAVSAIPSTPGEQVQRAATLTNVLYEKKGPIAYVTLNRPKVLNALSQGAWEDLRTAFEQARDDAAVLGVILTGAGDKAFIAGEGISELAHATPVDAEKSSRSGQAVLDLIENLGKPVIAAVNGFALGGGCETAMACTIRIAAEHAQLGQPEVKLGIPPGAGGTQRLPRLVGLERALNMIVSGNPVSARDLANTELLDSAVDGDVLPAAAALAERVIAEKLPLKKARDIKIDFPNAEAFLDFARGAVAPLAKNYPAPLKCIDAVEAAVLKSFDDGMKTEASLFIELLNTPESKALRHAFFAMRAAAKVPDVPSSTPLRAIKSVAVIGAGTMGGGIAMNFANAGIPVTVLETTQAALDKGLSTVRKNYENTLKKGRLTQI